MLPGYPAGVAATSPPYPTPRGAIPWGHPARNYGRPRSTAVASAPLGGAAVGGSASRYSAVGGFTSRVSGPTPGRGPTAPPCRAESGNEGGWSVGGDQRGAW